MVAVAGTDCSTRNPASPSSCSHSSCVRSRPPALTSIITSRNFNNGSALGGPTTPSMTSSRASAVSTAADPAQNRQARLVHPVVQDPAKDVRVGTGRDGVEEAPAHHLDTVGDTLPLEQSCGVANHVRLIEQDATRLRVGPQDQRQHRPRPTAQIGDHPMAAEVVGVNLVGRRPSERAHRRVEHVAGLRMEPPMLPHVHAQRMNRRVLTAGDTVPELTPRRPLVVGAQHHHRRRHRHRMIGPQQLSHRVEFEDPAVELVEHADRSERPQQPVQRRGVRPRLSGKVVRRSRAPLEPVGDTELGGDLQRLRPLIAPGDRDQLDELAWWRHARGRSSSGCDTVSLPSWVRAPGVRRCRRQTG